jgi:type IV pilus assembly protein PilA
MDRKIKKGFTLIEIIIVVVIIALLAAMAIPAYNKVRQNAKNKEILQNLKVIATAGTEYLLENEAQEVNYSSLEGTYLPAIKPIAGEDYSTLVVSGNGGTLNITQANGTTVSLVY